ncbi:MAG: L-lactate dehydrogenase [Campylobacterales bacterium]
MKRKRGNMISNRVGVVGAGNVGSAIVNAMLLLGVSREIVFYNRTLQRAEAEAWDISDGIPLTNECTIKPTDKYSDLSRCDIVVVTIGAKQKEGQSRLDLLKTNASIIKDVVKNLDEYAPNAKIVLVSNPVDIITRVALSYSKRASNLVFGSGTILDTARLRDYIGKVLKLNRKNIHAYIIGEHGDSEFVPWSNAYVSSIKLENYPLEGLSLEELKKESLLSTKKRAYSIISRKGYTNYGIGVSTAKLVKSILRDERKILPISYLASEEYGLTDGTVLSLPCVVGRDGVHKELFLELEDSEKSKLLDSAKSLEDVYHSIV